jgi:hypothetical protein
VSIYPNLPVDLLQVEVLTDLASKRFGTVSDLAQGVLQGSQVTFRLLREQMYH